MGAFCQFSPGKTAKHRVHLIFFQSGPRKFTKSDFSGLAPIWRPFGPKTKKKSQKGSSWSLHRSPQEYPRKSRNAPFLGYFQGLFVQTPQSEKCKVLVFCVLSQGSDLNHRFHNPDAPIRMTLLWGWALSERALWLLLLLIGDDLVFSFLIFPAITVFSANCSGVEKLTWSSLEFVFFFNRALFAYKNGRFASSFLLLGIGFYKPQKRQICLSNVPLRNPIQTGPSQFCTPKLLLWYNKFGNGPNTVSESTVSDTELSELFCPH